MSRPQHDFKKYLIKEHVHEETAVGDLARDVRLDLTFPATGERRDLRRYLDGRDGVCNNALITFEEAWRLYEPDGSPADHPFSTFLLRLDLRDGTPLSTFALRYAGVFSATGDRDALRAELDVYLADEDDGERTWQLACFDVAFDNFTSAAAAELL